MKFLANENFPLDSVKFLRKKGFDISAIGEDNPSISDREVLEIANLEKRTILTFDRDYGELIFKYNIKPTEGVIYFRLGDYDPEEPGQIVEMLTEDKGFNTSRRLIVFDRTSIRQKKY